MRTKLLIFIIALAFVLRFTNLGQNPPSLNWDEIAIGYNAYSLVQTGKDEFGITWPSTFRSFDDYKSPAYIYATVASIVLFGKTEFAIRFASAFFGTLTIVVFYFFSLSLLRLHTEDKNEYKNIWYNRLANISILATFMLAVSPWHVHFSRVGFEANFALFWEILGAFLFLIYIKQNNKILYLLGSVLSFAIALYSYANARLFIALLLIGWSLYYRKQIRLRAKQFVVAVILGLILSVPLLMQMQQGIGLTRYKATSVIYRPEIYTRNDLFAKYDFDAGHGRLSSLVHNYRIPLFQEIFDNYTSHFSYGFLFIRGDLPRHQIPGFGLLYYWQLPLILIGVAFLVKNKQKNLQAFPLLWWIFVSPIAAALTWQVPHSIRAEVMLPVLTTLSGTGCWALLKWIQKQDLKTYTLKEDNSTFNKAKKRFLWIWPKLTFVTILVIMSLSSLLMILHYSVHLPKEFSKYWLFGRKEMVEYVLQEKPKYQKVVVSLRIEWAYLWFLWYGPYTPNWYLSQGGTVSGGFEETQNKIENIEFRPLPFTSGNFGTLKSDSNTIYVGIPEEFPKSVVPDKTIYDLSGNPIIYIVKT